MREAGAQPRRGLVVLVLGVLLMTPYLTLAESSGSDASGRSGKDMYVVDTRFDSPGSVFVDGIVHLSTATHTFQVKVGNAGVSGASDVSVQHRTTSAAEWVNVGSTASTGTLAPGATTAWMSFSLDASAVGPNQEVRVLISTEGDANPSNNNRTTVFDVEDITSGYITSNDLPPPADGSSRIRLTTTSNFPVITNVVNNGTQDAQVNIRIELHDSGGIVGSPWQSGLTTVNANRVSTPFQSVAITTTLNLAAVPVGDYTLRTTAEFTASSPTNSDSVLKEDSVTVSQGDATLSTPGTRNVDPGSPVLLSFTLRNLDSSGTQAYTLAQSNLTGWVTGPPSPAIATLAAGGQQTVTVPVTVPSSAPRTASETVTLYANSSDGKGLELTSIATLFAGERYGVLVAPSSPNLNILPSEYLDLTYTVRNDGNVRTSYDLTAGFTSGSPQNWEISLGTQTTGILNPAQSETVTVRVRAAPLSEPLDPDERNAANDVVTSWLEARPSGGGTSSSATVNLTVQPTLQVQPICDPNDTLADLETEDLLNSDGSPRSLNLLMPILLDPRHNLGGDYSSVSMTVTTVIDTAADTTEFVTFPDETGTTVSLASELSNWAVSLAGSPITGFDFQTQSQVSLMMQSPSVGLPRSGWLNTTLEASATVPGSSAIQVSNAFATCSIRVPSIHAATIEGNTNPITIMPGSPTVETLYLNNTGNSITDFRIDVDQSSIPDGWTVDLTTEAAGLLLDDVVPITSVPLPRELTLDVTAPIDQPSGSGFDLTVMLRNGSIGSLAEELVSVNVPLRTAELENFSISDNLIELNIDMDTYDAGSPPGQYIRVENNGNVRSTYIVNLSTVNAGDVVFNFCQPSSSGTAIQRTIVISPGQADDICIHAKPVSWASADAQHRLGVSVSTTTGITRQSEIRVNINESNTLEVDSPDIYQATPGVDLIIAFNATNVGNNAMSLATNATVEDDWTITQTVLGAMPVNASASGQITVDIPSLAEAEDLFGDDRQSEWILLLKFEDTVEGTLVHTKTIRIRISGVFLMDVQGFEPETFYGLRSSHTYVFDVTYQGNEVGVRADIDASIRSTTTDEIKTDWDALITTPQDNVYFPADVPVEVTIVVTQRDTTATMTNLARLFVEFNPTDDEIEGNLTLNSTLNMARIFADPVENLFSGSTTQTFSLDWAHIPRTSDAPAAYEIELCNWERIGEVPVGGGASTQWSVTMEWENDAGAQNETLDRDTRCPSSGSAGPDFRYNLGTKQARVTNEFQLRIDPPANPPPGDGLILTFNLYHPTENDGYTVAERVTYRFVMDSFASPGVRTFVSDTSESIQEETETIATATIVNKGTATAYNIIVAVVCQNGEVESEPESDPFRLITDVAAGTKITVLPAGQASAIDLSWTIVPDAVNWWTPAQGLDCTVSVAPEDGTWNETTDKDGGDNIVALGMSGNQNTPPNVVSWSPTQTVSITGFILALVATVVFGRLAQTNDRFRLGAAYTGALAFGFFFHVLGRLGLAENTTQVLSGLTIGQLVGPGMMLAMAIWAWRLASRSGEELQLIHEDYQRARKGLPSLYADHADALNSSRLQITMILAFPVLGFMGVVLGVPPKVAANPLNLLVLIAYPVLVAAGVYGLLTRVDRTYGSAYGRLTDAEQLAQRIEKDLGDPARIMAKLASLAQDSTAAGGKELVPIGGVAAPAQAAPPSPTPESAEAVPEVPEESAEDLIAAAEAAVVPDAIELPPLEIAEDFDFDAATKAFEEAEEKSRALAEELDLDLDDLVLVDDGENGPRLVPSAMAEEMIAKGGKMLVPQPGWEYPLASKPGRQLVPQPPPDPAKDTPKKMLPGEGDMIEEEEKDVEIVAKENSKHAGKSVMPTAEAEEKEEGPKKLAPSEPLDEEKKPKRKRRALPGSGEMIDDDETASEEDED